MDIDPISKNFKSFNLENWRFLETISGNNPCILFRNRGQFLSKLIVNVIGNDLE